MEDFFSVPEKAIIAFEKWSQLRIFFWDLEQTHFYPYLPPERCNYAYPHCQILQQSDLRHKCNYFEREYVLERLGQYPEGLTKICHAGLVEWCMPIFLERRLVTILYAGQHTVAVAALVDLYDPQPASHDIPWAETLSLPRQVSPERLELIAEGLRQLAARLTLWLQEAQELMYRPARTLPIAKDLVTRRNLILNFVHEHHTRKVSLQDLAVHLNLSRSRTAHVVREACGQSLSQLIATVRLRSARGLLSNSELTVHEVAQQCGYGDASYFFKCFKADVGMTPQEYRHQQRHGQMPR